MASHHKVNFKFYNPLIVCSPMLLTAPFPAPLVVSPHKFYAKLDYTKATTDFHNWYQISCNDSPRKLKRQTNVYIQ